MQRICSHCGRHYDVPGKEHDSRKGHTMCARCTLCVYYAGEAKADSMTLRDWLKENPEDEREFLNVLKEEVAHAVVWEGEDSKPADPVSQALYMEYVRKAHDEIRVEL